MQQGASDLRAWYDSPLGQLLAAAEHSVLEEVFPGLFGYHLVEIGGAGLPPALLDTCPIRHRMRLDDAAEGGGATVRGHVDALPVRSDSIDAVILTHVLEFAEDPHQVLREIDRVLVPEGHLVIVGFNPWSSWGLWRVLLARRGRVPWCGRFFSPARLRDWLRLLGFDVEQLHIGFYRPPFERASWQRRLQSLEAVGERWYPYLGGTIVLVARKRVSTLTPIRPFWRTRSNLVRGGVVEPSTRNRA